MVKIYRFRLAGRGCIEGEVTWIACSSPSGKRKSRPFAASPKTNAGCRRV